MLSYRILNDSSIVLLQGDFTRTGERKISGMMKDGMNSANRYYLRFKGTSFF